MINDMKKYKSDWYQLHKKQKAEYYQTNKKRIAEYHTSHKEQIAERSAKYYRAHKKEAAARVLASRRRQKIKAVSYLGGCCVKCGYCKCIWALQFHHRRPEEKRFGVSEKYVPWNRLTEELDKCDLLCANCHVEEEERIYIGK